MESYVQRWAREQKEQKAQKGVVEDGRNEKANGQTEREQGQKAQKHRRVSRKLPKESEESESK